MLSLGYLGTPQSRELQLLPRGHDVEWFVGFQVCAQSLIVICLLAGGLRADEVATTQDKARSRLAGSWYLAAEEAVAMQNQKVEDPLQKQCLQQCSYLIITFNEDGTVDWSRTLDGVSRGISRLRQKGDSCQSAILSAEFTLLDCQYSEDETSLIIKRTGEFPAQYRLRARLLDTGELEFSSTERVVWNQLRLRRSPIRVTEGPQKRNVKSLLSGAWGIHHENGNEELLFRFREDGSLDWTGTQEANFWGWYQLDDEGDKCCHRLLTTQQFRVAKAIYERTRTVIGIQQSQTTTGIFDDDRPAYVIDASLDNDNELILRAEIPEGRFDRLARTQKVQHISIRLHRLVDSNTPTRTVLRQIEEIAKKHPSGLNWVTGG